DAPHLPGVGDVQGADPQPVLVPAGQVVQLLGPAQGRGDPLPAGEQLLAELTPEATRGSGNEPRRDWHVPIMTCRTTRQRVAWHDTNLGPFVVLNRLCLRGYVWRHDRIPDPGPRRGVARCRPAGDGRARRAARGRP